MPRIFWSKKDACPMICGALNETVGMKKFVIWQLYLSVALVLITLSYGTFQYFIGETLEERYWAILVSLVALTGPAINYLMSASRAEKTEATKVQE